MYIQNVKYIQNLLIMSIILVMITTIILLYITINTSVIIIYSYILYYIIFMSNLHVPFWHQLYNRFPSQIKNEISRVGKPDLLTSVHLLSLSMHVTRNTISKLLVKHQQMRYRTSSMIRGIPLLLWLTRIPVTRTYLNLVILIPPRILLPLLLCLVLQSQPLPLLQSQPLPLLQSLGKMVGSLLSTVK